ncbi:hypothetical protein CHS0354_014775 [Potamilus streckersoni]|uniref:RanBP2-type domain-containing protein n=1 Tax=Potamilus streckersoni TaxID=2493646 RepID=A0AAE0S7V9_9BIVA|nr:hypothetical protein CHS0354_014775 [Potamilus streckersoni]
MAIFVEDFITSRTATSRCEIFLTQPICIPDDSGSKRNSNSDFLELYKFTPDLCQMYLFEIPDCDPDKLNLQSIYSKKIHLSLILNKVKDGRLRYKLKNSRWHEVSLQQGNGRLSQFVIKITEEEESPWFQAFYDCLKNTFDRIKSEDRVAPISTFVLVAVSDQEPSSERKVNVTDVKLSKNSRIRSWIPQFFKRKPKTRTRSHSVCIEKRDSEERNIKLARRPNSLSVVSIPSLDPSHISHPDSNINQYNNFSGVNLVQDRKSPCETSPQPFQPGFYTPGIAYDFLQRSKSLEVLHLAANENWDLHKTSASDSEKEESPIQEEIPQRLEAILESLKNEDLLQEITIVENKETSKPMITPRGKSMENMSTKGDNLKKVAALLQAAISEGDQMKAQLYAANLAAKMAKVTITIESEEPQAKVKEFSIKVFIEDKETSGGSISLRVKATDTIRDLKNKMLLKHMFPIEIQKWIIGKRLVDDKETLAKCKVTTEGHSVYLYLVSARSVGLTKDDFQNRMARLLKEEPPMPPPAQHSAEGTGDYISMKGVITPQLPPSVKPIPGRQHSFPSPAPAPVSVHSAVGRQGIVRPPEQQIVNERPVVLPNVVPFPGQRINPNNPVVNLGQIAPPELVPSPGRVPVMHPSDYQEYEIQPQQGWRCPACTFINVPTRPGCAICTQPRPPDYEIPDGYVMSEEERKRLQIEEQLEKQAREAENQDRKRGKEKHKLSEKELDNLLKFNDALIDMMQNPRQENEDLPDPQNEGNGNIHVLDDENMYEDLSVEEVVRNNGHEQESHK